LQVFLSYHTPDRETALALKQALEQRDPGIKMFVDQSGLRAGAFWLPKLGDAIRESDAFVMLVGNRLGDWQKLEYYEALDRKAKQQHFAIIPIICVERPPNLPFLSQLHWITVTDPDTPEALGQLINALQGSDLAPAAEPWRNVNPYRGLLALDEEDADFFYGREAETAEVLNTIIARPSTLIALIGNSGVGKSSLVQAGVIGCLKRQRWPVAGNSVWPDALKDSRAWAYINIKPGADPIGALASAFVALWFARVTDPGLIEQRNQWARLMASGEASLRDLIDATDKHFRQVLNVEPPRRIVLYIDQGEELYGCDPATVAQFSKLIAAGLEDERLIAITSQRSDTYGSLQANDDLFPMTVRIDVAPVGTEALRAVLVEPPRIFGARYDNPMLVDDVLAQAKGQRGALPLVADFMEDLWLQMQQRQDGVIRAFGDNRVFYLGGNLIERCELFMQKHASKHDLVKRLFTHKLVRVYELGEPVAYHVTRAEATDEDWQVIEDLAAPNWRLVVISEQGGQPRAEAMHDILIRQWPRLQEWLTQERELAIWRTRIESSYRLWQGAGRAEKHSLLLSDYVLHSIITDDAKCRIDIGRGLTEYIYESARVRGSWWSTSYAFMREMYAGVTFMKVLLGILLICGGSIALVGAGVGLDLILKRTHLPDDAVATVAGLVVIVGFVALTVSVVRYLFRDKKRAALALLARNLSKDLSLPPTGVGGALVLVVLFIALLIASGVYEGTSRFSDALSHWAAVTGGGTSGRLLSTITVLIYVAYALTTLLGVVLLIAILKHKPAAYSLAFVFLGASGALGFADAALNAAAERPDTSLTEDMITAIVMAALCVACAVYFTRSKRVRATFGRLSPT
jgi:hypothetical protein